MVEVPCGCALDGDTNHGYCQQVAGTEIYRNTTSSIKSLLTLSTCHTLDRDNYAAQKDRCGGQNPSLWEETVRLVFNVTYWPLVQSNVTYNCIINLFSDSYENLNNQFALGLAFSNIATMVAMSMYL